MKTYVVKIKYWLPVIAGALLLTACLDTEPAPFQDIGPLSSALTPGDSNQFYIFSETIEFPQTTESFFRGRPGNWERVSIENPVSESIPLRIGATAANDQALFLMAMMEVPGPMLIASEDRGDSWQVRMPANLGETGLPNGSNLLACGEHAMIVYTDDTTNNPMAYHSSDGGQSWNEPYQIGVLSGEATNIMATACNSEHFYVLAVGGAVGEGPLFHTTTPDEPDWSVRNNFPFGLQEADDIQAPVHMIAHEGRLFGAGAGSSDSTVFFYSTDQGQTTSVQSGYNDFHGVRPAGLVHFADRFAGAFHFTGLAPPQCSFVMTTDGQNFQTAGLEDHGFDCVQEAEPALENIEPTPFTFFSAATDRNHALFAIHNSDGAPAVMITEDFLQYRYAEFPFASETEETHLPYVLYGP